MTNLGAEQAKYGASYSKFILNMLIVFVFVILGIFLAALVPIFSLLPFGVALIMLGVSIRNFVNVGYVKVFENGFVVGKGGKEQAYLYQDVDGLVLAGGNYRGRVRVPAGGGLIEGLVLGLATDALLSAMISKVQRYELYSQGQHILAVGANRAKWYRLGLQLSKQVIAASVERSLEQVEGGTVLTFDGLLANALGEKTRISVAREGVLDAFGTLFVWSNLRYVVLEDNDDYVQVWFKNNNILKFSYYNSMNGPVLMEILEKRVQKEKTA
jgi:hypothetical protein